MLSDIKDYFKEIFVNLSDKIFVENIFASCVIIFELFNINKHFILAWIVTLFFCPYKNQEKKIIGHSFYLQPL